MASPVDDRGSDGFLELLQEGGKGPGPKTEALEALSLRPVWLATWEPRAEGYRTLINANGEEALAVFSSEEGLKNAAAQFDWLEADGSFSTHRAIGGDILRHAWTRDDRLPRRLRSRRRQAPSQRRKTNRLNASRRCTAWRQANRKSSIA